MNWCDDGIAGFATKVTDPLGHVTETSYDALGRKSAVTDAAGSSTLYRYTPSGRLWQVEDALGGITEYGYDERGNRVMVRDAKGHETWFDYDLMDRLVREVNPLGKETVFTHDAAGNRLSKTFASGNAESYGYDALNRLTSASYPSGREVQYDYDPVGNRNFVIEQLANGSTETTTYTYSAFNQVLTTTDSQGTTSYGWDDNGNLVGKQTPSGAQTLYSYNHANRLVEILYPNGHTNHFGYDPQGIRTYKQDAEGTTHFLIDRVSVLATYDGAGTQKSWLNHNPQRIDEIISQVQAAGPPGGDVQTTKLFHLVDGLGSVYGLVNQAGAKVASYGYDAYGAVTDAQVEPGLKNNRLFTGRELDADSGWQYNRARYYLAGLGSWDREDPYNLRSTLGYLTKAMGSRVGGYFKYSHRPTATTDPYGLITRTTSSGYAATVSLFAGESFGLSKDSSWDTDGCELNTWTATIGITFGIALDVAIAPYTRMWSTCGGVCCLLGWALLIVVNLTVGFPAYFGVATMVWTDAKGHWGHGTSVIVGVGIESPINFTVDFLLAYTWPQDKDEGKCRDGVACN